MYKCLIHPDNIYVNPNTGRRQCRDCRNIAVRKCYEKKVGHLVKPRADRWEGVGADPAKRRAASLRYHRSHKKERLAYSMAWTKRTRAEMIDAYGAKCNCCGETGRGFLTLDHIHGGGGKHIRETGIHNLATLAKREGYPKDKYQLLCANCNMAKSWHGACPHTLHCSLEVSLC